MRIHNKVITVIALSVAASISGCGGGNSGSTPAATIAPVEATYEVKVTNITSGQVLTPIAVVLHDAGYTAWKAGSPSTLGLEHLAEAGSTTEFVEEAKQSSNVVDTAQGKDVFTASLSQTVSVKATHSNNLELTVAAMLAKTNDAFTGVTNLFVGELSLGESITIMPHVYDAGTEDNTETNNTVAAFGVEGFSANPQSINPVVTIHPGVVTQADGLTTSALTEKDRWLSVAALIVVTRTQ